MNYKWTSTESIQFCLGLSVSNAILIEDALKHYTNHLAKLEFSERPHMESEAMTLTEQIVDCRISAINDIRLQLDFIQENDNKKGIE